MCALFNGSKKQVLHKVRLNIFNLCIDNKINLLPEGFPEMTMSSQNWLQRMLTEMTLCCTQTFSQLWILLLTDLVPFIRDSCQGLIVVGPILVLKVLMLFLLDGIMKIIGWLFPPPKLIPRVLQHLAFSKAEETLIVPEWPSAHWWPLIYQGKCCFINEVRKFLVIHPRKNAFLLAVPGFSLFDDDIPNFSILALRICC